MSGEGYHRRKQPNLVRQAVLQAASALACDAGIQSLTIQAVADRAGVTKGGLMHHFHDKEALLVALRSEALTSFETVLNQNLTDAEGVPGRFTRAYVKTCLAPMAGDMQRLVAALWADPGHRRNWYLWLDAQEAAHRETDGAAEHKLARLAADGAWLAMTDGKETAGWLADILERI